jgi:hypothetical protein
MSLNGFNRPNGTADRSGALQAALLASRTQTPGTSKGENRVQPSRLSHGPQMIGKALHTEGSSLSETLADGLAAARSSVTASTRTPHSSKGLAPSSIQSSNSATVAAKASFDHQINSREYVEEKIGRFNEQLPTLTSTVSISRSSSSQSVAAPQLVVSNSLSSCQGPNEPTDSPKNSAKHQIQPSPLRHSKERKKLSATRAFIGSETGFYNLPQAVISEPVLSTETKSRDGALPTKSSTQGRYLLSDAHTLPTRGAAAAMNSRSSSQVSLPTLASAGSSPLESSSLKHKRPIHLKTTMRKSSGQENEDDQKRCKTQTLSESEKKRYEGVWAANQTLHLGLDLLSEDTAYVDGIIVREVWKRSTLPSDVLRHIW